MFRFFVFCLVASFIEKSESARNGGCFDQNSTVIGHNGQTINIDNLRIGDEILTMNPSTGHLEYSSIIMFLDRNPSIERLYYEIETEFGRMITATPSHLLFISDTGNIDDKHEEFVSKIEMNQYLFVVMNQSDYQNESAVAAETTPRMERIIRISTKKSKGIYAPLTVTGTIVVNNIVASCYAIINSQQLSHLSFIPIRWLYQFIKFGDYLSQQLHVHHSQLIIRRTSKQSDQSPSPSPSLPIGIHWYPRLLYTMFNYFIPNDYIYQ